MNQVIKYNKIKSELEKEIEEDKMKKRKEIVKKKIIEINRLKELLKIKEQQLDDILSGKDNTELEDWEYSERNNRIFVARRIAGEL